ncbi:MAG: response regulator transcription factor [Chloroflexi bacterium]|nr:response regulator transcription factor [Chloroflexota bacterium]
MTHSPPQPARILLIDDDPDVVVVLAAQLRADGMEVTTAGDGLEALRQLEDGWPDLIVMDVFAPGLDGWTLARLVKERADLPIIVLSAVASNDSKADVLEEVGEDYVVKPYHYPELRARISRVLQRVGDRSSHGVVRLGPDLTLELHRRRATVAGQPVNLSPFESRLLYVLVGSLGTIVPTDVLVARGWGDAAASDASYVWATMRRLRQKLERDPDHPVHLETVRGAGYRLNRLPETPASEAATGPTRAGDGAG